MRSFFEDWNSFLAMGDYGAYVWPSYGLAAAILVLLAAQSYLAMRRAEREAASLRAARRRGRPEPADDA